MFDGNFMNLETCKFIVDSMMILKLTSEDGVYSIDPVDMPGLDMHFFILLIEFILIIYYPLIFILFVRNTGL